MESEIWNAVKDLAKEDLIPDAGPVQKAEPAPSNATILSIVDKLRYVALNGGYLGIARDHKVSMRVVKVIDAAMQKRLMDLAAVEP